MLLHYKRMFKYTYNVPPQITELVESRIQQSHNRAAEYDHNVAGGSSAAGLTLLSYLIHFRGFTRFFMLMDDYDSLLMLFDKYPKNCPSVRVKNWIIYDW